MNMYSSGSKVPQGLRPHNQNNRVNSNNNMDANANTDSQHFAQVALNLEKT